MPVTTPLPPLPPFSRWLREFLHSQGHTQEAAGRVIGVNTSRVGQVLRGDPAGAKFLEGVIRGYGLEARREELERLAGVYRAPDPPLTEPPGDGLAAIGARLERLEEMLTKLTIREEPPACETENGAEVLMRGLESLQQEFPSHLIEVPRFRGGVESLTPTEARETLFEIRRLINEGRIPQRQATSLKNAW